MLDNSESVLRLPCTLVSLFRQHLGYISSSVEHNFFHGLLNSVKENSGPDTHSDSAPFPPIPAQNIMHMKNTCYTNIACLISK